MGGGKKGRRLNKREGKIAKKQLGSEKERNLKDYCTRPMNFLARLGYGKERKRLEKRKKISGKIEL